MSEAFTRHNPEDIINQVRPGHHSILWIEGGDNRDVLLVDEREAFRFPKDEGGVEAGRYEFEVLKMLQGKLTTAIPKPIELAPNGSYNVLSYLPGRVLSKQATAKLSFEKRLQLGLAIGQVINELNESVTEDELRAIPSTRSLTRNRDDYYASVYEMAMHHEGTYQRAYMENYERLLKIRPNGSRSNIVVFGDFSSPNLVLSDDDRLDGLIDWTELGLGDIHNELRPVFSVIGQEAFDKMIPMIHERLGSIDRDLVQLCAVVHELSVLVNGKQKGMLSAERTELAIASLNQWLNAGWEK